ncbi:hypothetical protein [Sulfurovum sp.]|uniref:hypothetical protein n=1 Tax=Sulfurovum sp. TaxID=1969726 RepID=UPI00356B1859
MIIVLRVIVISSLVLSLNYADSNSTIQGESSYIDKLHKSISETVIEWSDIIDTTLSNWLDDNETNTTDPEDVEENITLLEANITDAEDNATAVKINRVIIPTQTRAVKTHTTIAPSNTMVDETKKTISTVEEKVHSVDQFFQNEKYLNETENTYVRVRVESYFQSKGSNDFDLTVRAQMPFSKSRKRFKIFVDDLTLDNADEILKDTSANRNDSPDIGIHYFASRHKILSRYSIGLSGIDPFVKARFNMPINIDEWLIDPVQLFKYSTDDKFEEETNIYFDKKVSEKSLFRIQLYRSTQEEIDGMNYALSAQYYRSTKENTGFGFTQSFFGNTEYQYTTEKDVPHPKTKKYGGIHDYVTSFSWRANIWRKWFYYEVRPSVSFHKQYDYEPNYTLRVFFDFYFGKFN